MELATKGPGGSPQTYEDDRIYVTHASNWIHIPRTVQKSITIHDMEQRRHSLVVKYNDKVTDDAQVPHCTLICT